MGEALTPTLEDLREVPEPAWLWDGARARIVWANGAGIAYFGGKSLFDLIDRPFDFLEPGVERIVSLTRQLRRGQVETALLHFPSMGAAAPLSCKCMIHALADGRPGLLVVAGRSATAEAQALVGDIAGAFDLLPTPAALIAADGAIRHLNAASLILLGAGQRATLAALLGDGAVADQLIDRIGKAGTVSEIVTLPARIGPRQVRLTGRRLRPMGDGSPFAMVLLDDVTERRALELKLAGAGAAPAEPQPAAVPGLAAPEAEAFNRLGQILNGETAAATPVMPAEKPVPAAPRRKLAGIPEIIRRPFDRLAEAVIIARDGAIIHANPAACQLFGQTSASDLANDPLLWDRFAALGQSLPVTDIDTAQGLRIAAKVQMSVIPWLNGPARQFIITRAEPQRTDAVALQVVPKLPRRSEDLPPTPEPVAQVPAAPALVAEPVSETEVVTLPPRPTAEPEDDAELRAILDTATDGIITLDAQANIHTFSAGAEAIFGYRIAEVAGKPFAELIAPESRKALRDYLAALQGPGLASVLNDGREVTAIVKQGGTVPLFLTLGKLQAPKSQAAFCAVVRDITQWKKTEQELREAKDLAEATSRQKSEFLARISHELRTPLNAIMGFSEVMRLQRFGRIDNDKYRGYVNDIHASGSHLLSLINDLLDLSKVEAGKLELNFTSVNLSEVAEHAIKMLQEQATAARVVLRKTMPAELPNVVADLRSMRQIMLNLLSNALKFTDPGGQVIVSSQLTPAGELKLRVKDTGIGMNAEQLRDALEPFRRVTTEGRDAPGTGLGLPLTKALAEANRTQFAISSEPRKGTLVEITFPTTRVLAE
ncbi:MAG: PAS domain S-box protein [Rhizobiales bacterium]|nr:PAS domain S-box protein [Hyphomicrobiales bacterium]MBI3674832.1 PAS domain S-box protein [Hyphomicrobiales bacterium]